MELESVESLQLLGEAEMAKRGSFSPFHLRTVAATPSLPPATWQAALQAFLEQTMQRLGLLQRPLSSRRRASGSDRRGSGSDRSDLASDRSGADTGAAIAVAPPPPPEVTSKRFEGPCFLPLHFSLLFLSGARN